MTDFDLNLYQALLEVSEAISTHQDLRSLFRDLRQRLRAVVPYDGVLVLLYDEERDYMREYFLESELDVTAGLPRELPAQGTPGGWVCHHQEPMFVADVAREARFQEMNRRVAAIGVNSYCVLPLTSAGRRLGALGFASRQPSVYRSEDRDFLMLVARQVAVAVDNTVNLEAAREAQQRFARERDRLQLLLEINNAVVSHLDLKELVTTVSASLRELIPHDAAGIALYEPEQNHLREYVNIAYQQVDVFREGDAYQLEGTPAGLVFTTGQPLLLRRPDPARFPADRLQQSAETIARSACLVPLISHGRTLGILGVANAQEEQFSEDDLELLARLPFRWPSPLKIRSTSSVPARRKKNWRANWNICG